MRIGISVQKCKQKNDRRVQEIAFDGPLEKDVKVKPVFTQVQRRQVNGDHPGEVDDGKIKMIGILVGSVDPGDKKTGNK
jgi:hypothetical protein